MDQPNMNYHYIPAKCDNTMPDCEVDDLKIDMLKIDTEISRNPVGSLQEICLTKKWPLPSYKLEQVEGVPHNRLFSIACELLSYREIGCGKSKKEAKREAAYKTYQAVKENFDRTSKIKETEKNKNPNQVPVEVLENRYSSLMDGKVNTISNDMDFAYKLVQFEMRLRHSDNEKLQELHKSSLDSSYFDCMKFLQDLSEELHFDITYIDIDQKSINGMNQCMLQISTAPLVVCFGMGKSTRDAQMSAAFNALEYMKITTRK